MKIAAILKKEQVLKPACYKLLKGDTRFRQFSDNEFDWKFVTVRKILTDMVYIGDMENGKYTVENYKTKKRVKTPIEKHIIVPNTHEAIISREKFKTVQEV